MELKQQVLRLVLECIERLNEQLPEEMRLEVAPSAHVVGAHSSLESLSLVSLLVDVEESLARDMKLTVNLLDDGLTAVDGPRFHTVAEMVDWVVKVHG